MENTPQHHKLGFLAGLLFVVFLLLVSVVFFVQMRAQYPSIQEEVTLSEPTQSIISGANFSLMPRLAGQSFTLNEPAIVRLLADSQNKEVVGYDVIITYDPTALKYVSHTNLLTKDFQTFEKLEEGKLTLTGAKNLNSQTPIVLKEAAAAELTFTPLKKGPATLSIEFVTGSKTDSNLIDSASQDILTSVKGMTITVE